MLANIEFNSERATIMPLTEVHESVVVVLLYIEMQALSYSINDKESDSYEIFSTIGQSRKDNTTVFRLQYKDSIFCTNLNTTRKRKC